MFNVCLRMVSQRDAAEDVLQEAFLKAFTRIDSFKFESTFGAWLKRIVVNSAINYLRKKKVETDYLDDLQNPQEAAHEDEIGLLDEEMLNTAAIQKAMKLLPEGYKVVFSLYAIEGYDHREIAGILGISDGTSKSQYNRARKKLKELLTNELCR